jgi:enoyl-CoA hydratase/carnithine racemase
MTEVVRTEIDGRVAVVTLNRPDKLNAMSTEIFEAIGEAGRAIAGNSDVRAVLLRGEGRAFSSGLDLSSFGGGGGPTDGSPAGLERSIPRIQASFNVWATMGKPVVAAVHGYALGAGLQLALAADLRLCAEGTTLSVFEITYGLVPDLGATQRLPRLVGPARAKELIWTARRFSAEEAEAWGVVNRVVPGDQMVKEARELCEDLASRPPLPIAFTKDLVNRAGLTTAEEGMAGEAHAQLVCLLSDDMREAVAAAFEKRPGSYAGN